MQETIVSIENELDQLLNDFIRALAERLSPISSELDTSAYFEGDRSFIIRENKEKEETKFENHRSELKIHTSLILYGSVFGIAISFAPVARDLVTQKEQMLIRTLEDVTKKTGNIVQSEERQISLRARPKRVE